MSTSQLCSLKSQESDIPTKTIVDSMHTPLKMPIPIRQNEPSVQGQSPSKSSFVTRPARELAVSIPRLFVPNRTVKDDATNHPTEMPLNNDTSDSILVNEVLSALSSLAPYPHHTAHKHHSSQAPNPPKGECQFLEVSQQGFEIISTIGEGSFSKVKLARHVLLDKLVALKIIDKDKLSEKGVSTKQLLREMLLLASLEHPNINRLLQVIDSPKHVYIVLEYESGGDLYDKITKNTKVSEHEARGYMRQIVCGLHYCHSQGVVHRDLKLENILISKNGVLKICDFGFSNLLYKGNDEFETFCGSPPYAAPEMVSRKKYQGQSVDIWSLGVILYIMVTGVMPFGQKSLPKMFVSIMSGKYEIPARATPECQSLIASMLNVKPSDRTTLDQIIAHPWMKNDGCDSAANIFSSTMLVDHTLRKDILLQVLNAGFDQSAIQSFVDTLGPGAVKTAYCLLLENATLNSTNQIKVSGSNGTDVTLIGNPDATKDPTMVRVPPQLVVSIEAKLASPTFKKIEPSKCLYSPALSTPASTPNSCTLIQIRQSRESASKDICLESTVEDTELQANQGVCRSFQITMPKDDALKTIIQNLSSEHMAVPYTTGITNHDVVFDNIVWNLPQLDQDKSPSFLEAASPEDAIDLLYHNYDSFKQQDIKQLFFRISLSNNATVSLKTATSSAVLNFKIESLPFHYRDAFEKLITQIMSGVY